MIILATQKREPESQSQGILGAVETRRLLEHTHANGKFDYNNGLSALQLLEAHPQP